VCLLLTVRLSEQDATRAPEIAAMATAAAGLPVSSRRTFFRRRSPELNIAEKPRHCACSLLANDADWDAPTWSMRPEILPRLAVSLAAIRQQTKDGFAFDALWGGDGAFYDKQVSPDEIRAIVEHGQISTESRYLVT